MRVGSPTIAPDADLQPVDWATIDNAIYDWVNGVLDIEDQIIWVNFNVAQLNYPYVTLLRNSIVNEGGRAEERTKDDGDSLELQAYEPVKFTLTLNVYVDDKNGGCDPNMDAIKLASKLKASLGLRSVVDDLYHAGLSIVDIMDVVDTSVVINTEWIKKATLDVIFRTTSLMTERVEFIEKVELKSNQFSVDTIIDAS